VARDVASYLEANEDRRFVTSTLEFEVIAVGEVLAREADFVEVRSQFEWIDVEPYTVRHAYAAAELEATMRDDGSYREAFAADLLIAGAARSLGAPVVTRNTGHFEQFDGIDVEEY
jgi:predicted nucleic acid-binding protein